ncbi:hypothetical protein [Bellilinea sp.]|jgi:hypothetical protein|uniref:hypothetical protein n=1 Tax=Bellilinea sp. TaxID=2838785 RepID=UPI002ADE25BE|nr:hypothetical protein [Bellilinea sp.]
MNDIPIAGWIALGIIAILLLVTNLSLISLLRRKGSNQSDASILSETMKTLNNPWEKEDRPLRELSEQVARLKELNQNKDSTEE